MSCPDCFRGGVAAETPTGTETTIHGVKTYVAKPDERTAPKATILFITDAFGWDFVNNRVLADRYAMKGQYTVYVPDFMDGNAMPQHVIALMDHVMEPAATWSSALTKPISTVKLLYHAIPWKLRTGFTTCHPRVISFLQALRTADSASKIGIAGFCWGGQHAIFLSHDDPSKHVSSQPLVDCIFTAHPSFLDVSKDIEGKLKIPTSVCVGDSDAVLKGADAKKMKEMMDGMEGHEMVIEPGAKHGFAIRAHPEDKHEAECANKAEEQALAWFAKWLG